MPRDQVEKQCPLCGAPRPPRTKRCVCNYTFEYDRPSRPAMQAAKPASPQATSILAIAIFAAVLTLAYTRTLDRAAAHGNIGFLLVPIGAFGVAGAYFNWGFFMRNSRARRVRFFLGSTGARYFYALLGGILAGGGVGLLIA